LRYFRRLREPLDWIVPDPHNFGTAERTGAVTGT
jgi:hypothetical protein